MSLWAGKTGKKRHFGGGRMGQPWKHVSMQACKAANIDVTRGEREGFIREWAGKIARRRWDRTNAIPASLSLSG